MKKQTLFLLATITMILFFAGCKDEDVDEDAKTTIAAEIVEEVAGTYKGTYTISLSATIMVPGAPPMDFPPLEDTDSDQEATIVFSVDPNDAAKANAVLTMQDVDILKDLAPGDPPPFADDTYTLAFNLINICEDQDGDVTYDTETSATSPRLETTKLMDPVSGNPVFFILTEDVAFTIELADALSDFNFNGSITGALEISKEMAALIIPGAGQAIPDGATVSIKFSISLIEIAFVPDPSS